MSKKTNGVPRKQPAHINRRVNALIRLESQLKLGVKNVKDGVEILSDKDIIRINKEISTLKSRT